MPNQSRSKKAFQHAARSAAVLLILSCSPDGYVGPRTVCGCPPPPPPPQPPSSIVTGRLYPADPTVNVDLVVTHFRAIAGDSTCTAPPGARTGYVGFGVSIYGEVTGDVSSDMEGTAECVHVFGKRDGEYVKLSRTAILVSFRDSTDGPFIFEAWLPAGPGTWERYYR